MRWKMPNRITRRSSRNGRRIGSATIARVQQVSTEHRHRWSARTSPPTLLAGGKLRKARTATIRAQLVTSPLGWRSQG